MMNKNNVPYYIAGTLATLTLLVSIVFAAAPYIGFLAPVAALSVGLPFIIGGAVFSAVAIALSYAAVSKNKTISEKVKEISEKNTQLADQAKEIEGKDKTIFEKDAQLTKKEAEVKAKEEENSEQKTQLAEKEKEISEKDAKLVDQAKEIEDKDKIISERDTKIEKDALKVAIADGTVQLAKGTVNGAVSLTKGAANGTRYLGQYVYDNYVPSIESTKGTLSGIGSGVKNTCGALIESSKGTISSVGNKLKNVKAFTSIKEVFISGHVTRIVKDGLKDVYGAMQSAEPTRNWVPSSKTAGWITVGAGLLVQTAYITVNGGLGIAGNSPNAVGNSVNSAGNNTLISSSLPTYLKPTHQQIMQIRVDEASKKLVDANKWYEDRYVTPKEDSLSNKGIFSSICNKVSSVWSSLGNLISGSNKDAHNHPEPQWSKDLHKSEDLEEIIDGGTLDKLFSPRVNNGINTSRQQGTLFDSANLEKLIQEPHPSAYPNGSPRIL